MSTGAVTDPTAPTLDVTGIDVERGERPVLHGVSISITPGEITTLLGPNGAGKSTLVLTVGGMLRPTSGSIALGDTDLTRARPEKVRAAGVAVVPEGRRLLPSLSVADNLRVATYTLPRDEAGAGVDFALELFPELKKRFDTPARSLSGGEQQMVVLAQALASRPTVLLVDELSLGLAPVVVKRLLPVMEQVADSGIGVLLIEQFAHVALALANNAYVLEGGRVQYAGTARELKDDPELLRKAYLLGA
jgi:branched-chain amino acid transport system ATP-binding protein